MWYPIKSPFWLRWMYPQLTWHRSRDQPCLYLTFDDGPVPEITIDILDILKSFNIKATFFCVGENILKHPEIYQRILTEGHQVGNHTHHHMKGWRNSLTDYIRDIKLCSNVLDSKLFRPPYGRGTRAQYS